MIDALEFKEELPKIVLLTVSIKEMIPMTIALTDKVQKAIPKVVDRVKTILDDILVKM